MITSVIDSDFVSWRIAARHLISKNISPEDVLWIADEQTELFEAIDKTGQPAESFRVPAEFVDSVELASLYDDKNKWALFYRILYRLKNENRDLIRIESDIDIRKLRWMVKAVRRDIHKFHAFVRFREVRDESGVIWVAWHEPHHFTVKLATSFFVRRFGGMRFSILTPKGCAYWDLQDLTFSPAVSEKFAPLSDAVEDLWLAYYRSIFNPYRLKIGSMKNEMPVRHWRTMPETVLIPELIRKAGGVKK